jgi:hypothetical protein
MRKKLKNFFFLNDNLLLKVAQYTRLKTFIR